VIAGLFAKGSAGAPTGPFGAVGGHSIPGWRDAMLFRDLLELPFGSGFV
jgi:hypothetical protein